MITSSTTESLREQVAQERQQDFSEEISRAEAKYARDRREGNTAVKESMFGYAYYLIRSRQDSERRLGVRLLEDELLNGDPENREYLYYLAYGLFLQDELEKARRAVNKLLSVEPGNRQAIELRTLIEDRIKSDGLVGVAILGGVAAFAVGAIAAAAIIAKKASR